MIYAFSPEGLARLERLRGQPVLFAFDFDGTLAPIVADSRKARLPSATRTLLTRLANAAPVAAVSGRPVGDLRVLVPKNLVALAGDHGAEIVPAKLDRAGGARAGRAVVKRWIRQLERALPKIPGVWLERKELSLCVHFRKSTRPAAAQRAILRAAAELDPPARILPGKRVVNLLNPALPHKGDAVLTLMSALKLKAALYVGDDSNDEDVFALADPRIRTVRIGRRADSRASFFLRKQSDIDRLLRFLQTFPPAR
jgi:trehalose 6-phosphate phosphatase